MLVLAGGIAGVSAELSSDHSLDIAGSMDVPTQTVETEWGEATITEVGREESGNNLQVSTDVPKNESYAIRIVDSEERNLESEFVRGDVERDFLLNRFEPGTYVVALTNNSGDTAFEVEPFIVKGYTVDHSTTDVTKGETVSISIQLTQVNDGASDPQVVNTTLFGNDVTRSVEATSTGENSYRANFSTDGLPTGSYDVYTGIETNDDIYGYNELIGLSETSVTVQEATPTPTPTATPTPTTTPTPTETPKSRDKPDETSAPAGGGGVGVEGSETATSTVKETSTGTAQSSSPSPASTSTSGSPSDQSDEVKTAETETQRQTSESTAIETAPQPSETESESVTTSSEMPFFPNGVVILFITILTGVLYRLQRSR